MPCFLLRAPQVVSPFPNFFLHHHDLSLQQSPLRCSPAIRHHLSSLHVTIDTLNLAKDISSTPLAKLRSTLLVFCLPQSGFLPTWTVVAGRRMRYSATHKMDHIKLGQHALTSMRPPTGKQSDDEQIDSTNSSSGRSSNRRCESNRRCLHSAIYSQGSQSQDCGRDPEEHQAG